MHVAVLGAGIMGGATALLVARRGVRVTLFDAAERPFARASRWNEGKIHLGHLYAGDRSLATARRVLPGGLAFKSLTESLIGCSLEGAVTPHDDVYLVHRDSVADAETTGRYLESVSAMALEHPDARRYLVDLSSARTTALRPQSLRTGRLRRRSRMHGEAALCLRVRGVTAATRKEHSAGSSRVLPLLVHSESAAGVAVAIAYASRQKLPLSVAGAQGSQSVCTARVALTAPHGYGRPH